MKKGCCPEMSRDANGYNRHGRNKALHNVASQRKVGISHSELKLYEGLLERKEIESREFPCVGIIFLHPLLIPYFVMKAM